MAIKAAVYLRLSKDQAMGTADEGLAVDRQMAKCRQVAAVKGWEIDPDWILDENDTSASGRKPRPQFEKLLRGMERGDVRALLVYDVDRLMRRLDDMVRLWDIAERRHVLIATASGEIDLTTPHGQSHAMLFGVVAAIEIKNLSRRLQAKAAQTVEQGRNANGGTRPYGFNLKRNEQVPAEAAIICEVAGRIIGGASLTSVCRDLNRRGEVTVGGRRWDVKKLRDVLNNERHAGRVEHRGTVVVDKVTRKPITAQWEPILDGDTFDALQAALADRRVVQERWSNDRTHLLSGRMLRCGVCGEKVNAHKQQTGKFTYRCRGHLSRDRDHTDRHVLDQVIAYSAEHPIRITSWETAQRAELSNEIGRLESRLTALETALVETDTDPARQLRVIATLDSKLAALRAERIDRLSLETGLEWSELGMAEHLAEPATDSEGIEQQRLAMKMYVDRVVLLPTTRGRGFKPESVQIVWRDVNRMSWRAVVEDTVGDGLVGATVTYRSYTEA